MQATALTVDFKRSMRSLVDNHAILRHEFFARLRDGGISREGLLMWAYQDRHVAYMFPRLIALIVARIAASERRTVAVRMPLLENLWEEVGEGRLERAHSTLMDDLLVSMGAPAHALDKPALSSTAEFIDLQFRLAEEHPIAGAGAFCYANEYLALKEYPPIQDAVLRLFPGADIRFFEANWEADGRHTELAEESIIGLCASDADFEQARRGAVAALAAREAFYDELAGRG